MNVSNPALAAGSCSSKNKSSGTLNVPCKQTNATPTVNAEVNKDPTLVNCVGERECGGSGGKTVIVSKA